MDKDLSRSSQAKRINWPDTPTGLAVPRTEQVETKADEVETRSARAIRESELRYRRLYEAALDGILILDAESGQVMDANPFMKDLLGYSQKEFLGKKLWEIGPFKGESASRIAFAASQKTDRIRCESLPLETKDGRRVEVEFISTSYFVDTKRFIQCNIRDITERRKTEQSLTLLRSSVSRLNDIVLITEADSIDEPGPAIIFVNEAFERITGYKPEETLGRSPRFLQGEKTDRGVLAEIRQALKDQTPIRRQVLNYGKDGTEFWLDIDIVPISDSTGKCTHFVAIERDITAAKKTEESLKLFRTLIDRSNDAIEVVDAKTGRFLDVNDTACGRLGYSREEMLSLNVPDIIDFSENPPSFRDAVEEIKRLGFKIFEGRHKRKDGSTFPIELNVQYINLDRPYLVSVIRDITERKRAEARFRRLVDSNAQGVIFFTSTGEITLANDAFLRLIRYTREDLTSGLIDWIAITPPEHAHLDQHALEEIVATGTCAPYEKEFICKDGVRIPVLIGAASFDDSPGEGVCFAVDLTESKKLEHRFLRAQRMESIGTLAGGIAHDLNNILAPILMSIDILKGFSDSPDSRKILETIEISAKRGADIVRQVLSFARGVEGKRVEVQPRHLLQDLENIIRDTFPKNIRLEFVMPRDTWPILGDPTQVHQVLLNLCVNSRDAMPNGGVLTVAAANCVLDGQFVAANVQAKAGRYVDMSVTDSGNGISPGLLDKIFEPFFTTKELSKGTGLGLSTVMGIVKSHGGIVNVYSEPGKGTTFNIYLPSTEACSAEDMEQCDGTASPRGNGETILVVDDEASILTVASKTLEAFGYRVWTCGDGAKALALYAAKGNEIGAVLIDMAMPLMDGPTAISALLKLNPAVKIIATSGFYGNGGMVKISGTGVRHFMAKPYTAGALLKAMRETLDQP